MTRDFDERSITAAVIDRFAATSDPRLKAIMGSLVRHLHDFVRDVEPTFDEWEAAIDFLTRTGQMCDDKRQEFILLSDTLGVSMLVDAVNHRFPKAVTQTTVLGPFYVENPPVMVHGANVSNGVAGEPLFVEGCVTSTDGRPIAGALVDIWHSDAEGFYDVQKATESALRARFHTGTDGRFYFWSIVPCFYPIPNDGPVGRMLAATKRHPFRPAHIHFMIEAAGHETLITHVFRAGDPYLDSDAVFGVKNSLIREFTAEAPGLTADGRRLERNWRKLSYDFCLNRTGAVAPVLGVGE
jgi:hydroxyquinol 1,2-dioxygenase